VGCIPWLWYNCGRRQQKSSARRDGNLLIPPPPSQRRPNTLRGAWIELLDRIAHPIFISIQPNTALGGSLQVRNPGNIGTVDLAWAALEKLFYRLDVRVTGCPKAGNLPPERRLQGFAALERIESNIHFHVLIDCQSAADQVETAIILFEALDTAPSNRCDDVWQQDVWKELVARSWLRDAGRTRTHSPLLASIMPRGTAAVQRVRPEDRARTSYYITKELGAVTPELANSSDYWAQKAEFPIRALNDWHAPVLPKHYARNYRVDPDTGALELNLDTPTWRVAGKRIC